MSERTILPEAHLCAVGDGYMLSVSVVVQGDETVESVQNATEYFAAACADSLLIVQTLKLVGHQSEPGERVMERNGSHWRTAARPQPPPPAAEPAPALPPVVETVNALMDEALGDAVAAVPKTGFEGEGLARAAVLAMPERKRRERAGALGKGGAEVYDWLLAREAEGEEAGDRVFTKGEIATATGLSSYMVGQRLEGLLAAGLIGQTTKPGQGKFQTWTAYHANTEKPVRSRKTAKVKV